MGTLTEKMALRKRARSMFWLSLALYIASIAVSFLAAGGKSLALIAALGSLGLQLAGGIVCIVGLAWYSRSKGQSKWLGTLGLLGWLGWLIVKYAIRDEWIPSMEPVTGAATPYPRGAAPAPTYEVESWEPTTVSAPPAPAQFEAPVAPPVAAPVAPPAASSSVAAAAASFQAPVAPPAAVEPTKRPPTPVQDHPLRRPAIPERAATANSSW